MDPKDPITAACLRGQSKKDYPSGMVYGGEERWPRPIAHGEGISFAVHDFPLLPKQCLRLMLLQNNCEMNNVLIDQSSSLPIEACKSPTKGALLLECPWHFLGEPMRLSGDWIILLLPPHNYIHPRFYVIVAPSTYKAIMVCVWLHELRVVLSTFHQALRYSSPRGVMDTR